MSTFLSRKFLIPTFILGISYIVVTIYLMNFALVKNTILGDFPLIYKTRLLFSLLEGMWTAMSGTGLITLSLIGFLTAANLTLVFDSIKTLRKSAKLQLVVGGNSLLGIVGSGCAACGLPILSLLGLSSSLMNLPYHGAELSYISLILLSISLYMLIKSRNQACDVNYGKIK